MRTNIKISTPPPRTHEGAVARRDTDVQKLYRLVMANMLFEDQFYVDGKTVADQIKALVATIPFDDAAQIALKARYDMKLRHVPLLITRELLRKKAGRKMGDLIESVIGRVDELSELVALYRADGGKSEPAQLKIGLARALKKFDAFQLRKYANKEGGVTLKDVIFMCHPRPKDEAQKDLFDKIVKGELKGADTWEVKLSAGADKGETFTEMLTPNPETGKIKLGAMALLRNLRNMKESGVPSNLIREGIKKMNVERVLPFRFISAANYAKEHEDVLEQAMFKCLAGEEKIKGKTVLLIDHSGSMHGCKVSGKSDIDRFDAATAVGMILREACEEVRIFAFSDDAKEVPTRRGFALRDAVLNAMPWGGTRVANSVNTVNKLVPDYDRIIVITDEQSFDGSGSPLANKLGYMVNVAAYQNGIGFGSWTTINGWSEAIIDYIRELEKSPQ